jgi:hypothetical protein
MLYTLICIAGIFGVWLFIRFIVTRISRDFGYGFAVGGAFVVLILWLYERMVGPISAPPPD